jgi:hypothetical protein
MSANADSMEMTIPEILAALTLCFGKFPEQAVRAAIAQREAITPHLLQALEEVAANPSEVNTDVEILHIFAAFLLAQFREKRAYPILAGILVAPPEIADDLFCEISAERLKNILASVYDGDPAPLKRLIENDSVEEFIRGAALETLLVLVRTGQMAREEVLEYFRSLFQGKLFRENNQVWNALSCAVADLPAPELLEDLRKAFEEGVMDPGYATFEELERGACTPVDQKEEWESGPFGLIEDVVEEMEWWVEFDPEESWLDEPMRPELNEPYFLPDALMEAETLPPSMPYEPPVPVRLGPKIGRNDPCPCGSGKKYKKCCLGADLR